MLSPLSRREFLVTFGAACRLVGPFLSLSRTQGLLFEEVPASQSGIWWVHENAMSEQRYLPETLGPGCAFLDYDNDGWMDLYLVNSGPCDFFRPSRPLKNALYKNKRDGTFTDVTEKAGVAGGAFGMGVAVADYNNDGYPDMLVTAYGRSILYRNNGDGTFTDVTKQANIFTPGWTTSAVWFDCDNDGLLDLFVCSFVQYGADNLILCGENKFGRPHYCIPRMFKPTSSFLFHNEGDGTFCEISRGTALGCALGKALGVVATDVNNDGRMDLFVSNDTEPNFLFLNLGDNRWREAGFEAQVAYSMDGQARSGMGVDAVDIDGDGWEDLFVANIDHERFSLYRNTGHGMFVDVALESEIGRDTLFLSGWGVKFFDFDNDGLPDLLLVNGHPDDMIEHSMQLVKYKEPLLLFRQENKRLDNISAEAGPVFSRSFAGRGLAIGDYNNDGRIDALVGVNGDAPLLLRNNAGRGNRWVGLKLQGVRSNRDGVGARITWSADGMRKSRLNSAGGSYLSSHDPRVVLGLGIAKKLDWVEIRWPRPSQRVERFVNLPLNRYSRIVEGEGEPAPIYSSSSRY